MRKVIRDEEFINSFREAMAFNGLLPEDIDPDGQIHRFSMNGWRDRSGWYCLFSDPWGGAYGDWREGVKYTWSAVEQSSMSESEKQAFRARLQKAQKQRERIQAAAKVKAEEKALKIWGKAAPASADHPYLKRKKLKPVGDIRIYGKALVVAVRSLDGQLRSLQFIRPDGTKLFLTDGQVQSCCSWIRGQGGTLVAEGWATAASIHKATGYNVVVCFNAGNIEPVVKAVLKNKPGLELTICGDDDAWLEKNVGIEKATTAAMAHRLKLATPTFKDVSSKPTDFDDLRRLEGLEEVRRQVEAAEIPQGPRVEWESPVFLDDYTPPVFEVKLPGILGEMVLATSAATETPIELAVGDCLATVATAVHGKIIVRIATGYYEPLNIWIATFLEPGNRKTAVLMTTTRPLSTWEAAKREKMTPIVMKAQSDQANKESRLKSLRAKYGRAKQEELEDISKEILLIETGMEEPPIYPRLWCDDVTPEYYGQLLAKYGGCMAVISAEGGIFDIIGGRYNGGIPNLDVFLKSHAGDHLRVDRGSRPPIDIEHPAGTFGLSPQPDVLKTIAMQKGFRGRGLLGRYNYFLPTSNLGHRTLETVPVPEGVSREWENMIHSLLDIKAQKDPGGRIDSYALDLSKEAHSEWVEFSMAVELELREGGRFEFITDWAGKLPGAAARLAGLFHCVKHPQQPWVEKISIETMQTALDLAAVFAGHTEIAFNVMGADKALEGAKRVWRWIERGRYESFKKRDCFHALRGRFPRVSDIEAPLDVLQERNYIVSYTHKTGGRPSIVYNVNPEIIRGWA